MLETILVPHDGYQMSDEALRYAIDIAKSMNMRIKILRVIPERVDISSAASLRRDTQTKLKEQLTVQMKKRYEYEYKKLEKLVSWVNSRGIESSSLVIEGGDAAEKIISIANKERPYMVIIGGRRLKRLAKLKILGSVSRKVSEECKRPVLIIR